MLISHFGIKSTIFSYVVCSLLTSQAGLYSDVAHSETQMSDGDFSAKMSLSKYANEMVFLSVDKKTLTASLRTLESAERESEVVDEFQIAVGKQQGDKYEEGDNKTPEGIYFVNGHIPGKKLPAKYGPYAITLDFPNPMDRQQKKTGYGIWLHGVERADRIAEAFTTEGCVAFHNQDIEFLKFWMRPKQSVVVIAEDSSEINKSQDLADVSAQTRAWYEAWSSRDLDKYGEAYDGAFSGRGMNKSQYLRYKRRVFGKYKKMRVEIDDIRYISHPKYAVSIFNQRFYGDSSYASVGAKVLYWRFNETSKQWKIVREVFSGSPFQSVRLSESDMIEMNSIQKKRLMSLKSTRQPDKS